MKIRRKSWHYRWRAYWMRWLGFSKIVEWRVTRLGYIADMFFFTMFLPLVLLLDWIEKGGNSRPSPKPKLPEFIEFIDGGDQE